MLQEKIKNILLTNIKSKEIVIETDKDFYYLWGSGFGIISKNEILVLEYLHSFLSGTSITAIKTGFGVLVIKLSDGSYLKYEQTGINSLGNIYYELSCIKCNDIDNDFLAWFEDDLAIYQYIEKAEVIAGGFKKIVDFFGYKI